LTVETFVWSHGYLRVLADQLDQAHARDQGLRLADRVRVCRQAYPDLPIYLLGHSAGCAVVLAAAEVLPPQSLDHIVLLAPSVPADYDLRPALRSVKHELDVFCSLRDDWYLRMGFWLLTVTHGRYALPAGNAGFRPRLESAEDARLYQKLCHYPWGPWLAWTGHEGGHFGYQQQGYLRGFVVPLLAVY
jgi:pimeloyl-ACP methyl ester carboxylesterase